MYYMFFTYLDVLIVATACFGLCLLLFGVAFCLSDSNMYLDKLSGYECGFDPFPDARDPFNIKFYLVSILFLIFDVEMIFFFPGIVSLQYTTFVVPYECVTYFDTGYIVMYVFVWILGIGFFYEYRKNALDGHE